MSPPKNLKLPTSPNFLARPYFLAEPEVEASPISSPPQYDQLDNQAGETQSPHPPGGVEQCMETPIFRQPNKTKIQKKSALRTKKNGLAKNFGAGQGA